ncbi:MAG: hypothetical protein KKB19_01605 [Bacteroidetes bacterium]|nr:hypothetical protein [Bacteroidota bacterium]
MNNSQKIKTMKAGYLFSIAVLPILMLGTPMMDQKEKEHKEKGNHEQNNQGKNQERENHDEERYDPQNDHREKQGKDKHGEERDYEKQGKNDWKQKGHDGEDKRDNKWEKEDKWTDGKWDEAKFDKRMYKLKDVKRDHWVNERVYNGVSWWTGNDYYKAKGPKGNKKVTICHKPNGSNYPVTISVSVNALQAHLNHGDYQGACKDYDRTVYSDGYWTNRDTYYNQYYQTTETLSFGEQLLNTAIDVLTNRKAQLVTARPTLTPNQINAREQAIINLQNNVYDLQTSLATGNQRVATINVNF